MEIKAVPPLIQTLQLMGCQAENQPPGWSYPRHHHFLFELLCCMRGQVKVGIGAETVVMQEGDWLIFKSGIPHEMANEGPENYHFFNLHFDVDEPGLREALCRHNYLLLRARDLQELGAEAAHLSAESACQSVVFLREDNEQSLERSIHVMQLHTVTMWMLGCFVRHMLLQEQTAQLGHEGEEQLAQEQQPMASPASNHNPTMAEIEMARQIESQLRILPYEKGRISEIAQELGLSHSHFSRVFTKVYGQSPREYRSQLVLREAKRLLLDPNRSIESIAEQLQFQSASQFSRQFRRWTGIAPSQFRPRPRS